MTEEKRAANFIEEFIDEDLKAGRFDRVHTRFPPEPNGYLHIGHAKALCIDFGIAKKYGGECNLRFDDTNPTKEDTEYVDGIMEDIRWLGYEWKNLYFASDFFDKLYEIACEMIRKGVAYVDDQSSEEMRKNRGTLRTPGVNSPYRDRIAGGKSRSIPAHEGGRIPRWIARAARQDRHGFAQRAHARPHHVPHPAHTHHHRTGDKWCIYPMYDFQHPIQDAIEGITHSLCSLEYEIHRPLYDWVVQQAGFRTSAAADRVRPAEHHPHGDEQALPAPPGGRRLRFRLGRSAHAHARRHAPPRLSAGGHHAISSSAWAWPRPTPRWTAPCWSTACARRWATSAPRAMAVLRPAQGDAEQLGRGRNRRARPWKTTPITRKWATRTVQLRQACSTSSARISWRIRPRSSSAWLRAARRVSKGAYIIRCDEVVKDENGEVIELICSVDRESRSGSEGSMRKVKATLHWVAACEAKPIEARLYEPILAEDIAEEEDTEGEEESAEKPDFIDRLNPTSLTVEHGYAEPAIADAEVGARFQFLRMGYFCKDPDSTQGLCVFNRTVPLKDSWAKAQNAR